MKPRRRIEIKIDLGADDWRSAANELRSIVMGWDRGEGRRGLVSGGPDSGYTVEVDEDPAWTHDRYFEAIDAMQKDGGG